jgi:hypothetical protein
MRDFIKIELVQPFVHESDARVVRTVLSKKRRAVTLAKIFLIY